MGNKKGNISMSVLTAMVFIFSAILLVSTIHLNSNQKQIDHKNEYIEITRIQNNLMIIGFDIHTQLNDNSISFDVATIEYEINEKYHLDATITKEENVITITFTSSHNQTYYREISFDGVNYTLSEIKKI